MKAGVVALVFALSSAPALAAGSNPVCIDPRYAYQAQFLSGHDIVATAQLGSDHRALKLTTTCIFLRSADFISLSADFRCIGRGDTVVTSTIDGHRQSCRITHVEPYSPAG